MARRQWCAMCGWKSEPRFRSGDPLGDLLSGESFEKLCETLGLPRKTCPECRYMVLIEVDEAA